MLLEDFVTRSLFYDQRVRISREYMFGYERIKHHLSCTKLLEISDVYTLDFFHRGSVYREYLSGFLKFRGLVSLIFEK